MARRCVRTLLKRSSLVSLEAAHRKPVNRVKSDHDTTMGREISTKSYLSMPIDLQFFSCQSDIASHFTRITMATSQAVEHQRIEQNHFTELINADIACKCPNRRELWTTGFPRLHQVHHLLAPHNHSGGNYLGDLFYVFYAGSQYLIQASVHASLIFCDHYHVF